MTLKEALKGKFLIGVALNADQITGRDTAGIRVVQQHFNSIVAENCDEKRISSAAGREIRFFVGRSIC